MVTLKALATQLQIGPEITNDWRSQYLELCGAAGKVRSRPVLLCPQLKKQNTQHCQVQLKKLCGLARQLMQDLAMQRTIHTAPTVIREAKNHGSIE